MRRQFAVAVMSGVTWLAGMSAANATSNSQPSNSQPGVRSQAALVIDAQSAAVIYARNANRPAPIASLTKLMTALIVLDAGQSLQEELTVTNADRAATQGSPSRLAVGAKLSRDDLLHVALMSSDNRAANALARNYPGGMTAAIAAMNAKARTLGMADTRFADATGLSARNVASPSDVALLVMATARHPTLRHYSTDTYHTITVGKRQLEFRNTNYLVSKDDWDIQLQKTGYTDEAGQCLAMQTTIDGRTLVIVLMDSFGKYTRTADARRIRKWLQAQADAHSPVAMSSTVAGSH